MDYFTLALATSQYPKIVEDYEDYMDPSLRSGF